MNVFETHKEFYQAISNGPRLVILCLLVRLKDKNLFVSDLLYAAETNPRNTLLLTKPLIELSFLIRKQDRMFTSYHLTQHFLDIYTPILQPILFSEEVEIAINRLYEREKRGELTENAYISYLKVKKKPFLISQEGFCKE